MCYEDITIDNTQLYYLMVEGKEHNGCYSIDETDGVSVNVIICDNCSRYFKKDIKENEKDN